MIKAAIIGAAGLSGLELIRILTRHPGAELMAVTSSRYKDRRVGDVFPELGPVELTFSDHDTGIDDNLNGAEVVFLAVPNQVSLKLAPMLLDKGLKVIDLSGVFRLRDVLIFEKAYGLQMTEPGTLEKAVFGLPEAFSDQISSAEMVANPGCYPTSALLGLLPLGELTGVLAMPPIVDAKSGVSGAGGRVEDDSTNFMSVNENFKAYKVFSHQHAPEIEAYLTSLTPFDPTSQGALMFTPHLLPIGRGILSTIYLRFNQPIPTLDLRRKFEQFATDKPFFTLLPEGQGAEIKHAVHTNQCVVSLHPDDTGQNWVVITAIDNLLKGASGQAVQNMNLMFGYKEAAGLI